MITTLFNFKMLLRWPFVKRKKYLHLRHLHARVLLTTSLREDSNRKSIQMLHNQVDELTRRNAELDHQATRIQRAFEKLLNGYLPLDTKLRRISHTLTEEQAQYGYATFVTPPRIELSRIDRLRPLPSVAFSGQQVKLVDCRLSIGLSEHTPPELVANDIGESVKDFITSNWRKQSVLLRKAE